MEIRLGHRNGAGERRPRLSERIADEVARRGPGDVVEKKTGDEERHLEHGLTESGQQRPRRPYCRAHENGHDDD